MLNDDFSERINDCKQPFIQAFNLIFYRVFIDRLWTSHGALSWSEGEPVNNKEADGWTTSRPLSTIVCVIYESWQPTERLSVLLALHLCLNCFISQCWILMIFAQQVWGYFWNIYLDLYFGNIWRIRNNSENCDQQIWILGQSISYLVFVP